MMSSTLEIIVQRKNEATWPVVMLETRPGELPVRSEGTLALDLDGLQAISSPSEYGTQLGKSLFCGDLREGFSQALAQTRAEGELLHVLLNIEDSGLKGLHWERLCAPLDGRWDHLALTQETPFSLYLPSLADRRFSPIGRRDLRALLLAAGPGDLEGDYGLEAFDLPAAVEAVQSSLSGNISCDLLANLPGAAGSPDLDSLCEQITAGSYTVLHILCHGKVSSKTGETALYFPRGKTARRPVTATQLIERMARLKASRGLPRFIFLMSCESGAPEAEKNFGGVGQRLVRELGTPAVLAMTAPVSIATANALAGAFYARLAEHGGPDRALGEALAGLQSQVDVTVPVLFSRLGGRPLFSDALDRELTPAEITHGIERFYELLPARAPRLDAAAMQPIETLKRLVDPAGLSAEAGREREQALAEINTLCEEITDLSFHALAFDRPVPEYDAACPFPGLAAFQPADRRFFFGREELANTLKQRLKENPFLAVLGASGSGKSSLVLAGLAPMYERFTVITPGAQPSVRLASALETADPDGLLVVDQFEELFTLCRSEEERRKFIGSLTSITQPVVITMRADFLGDCAPYPALKSLLQRHSELIPPMSAVELRAAVERQSEAAGLRFEADVADDILEDVKSEPGAMPLLQHALHQLWQRRRGRWLRLAEYRDGGGVRQAIAHTADEIFAGLGENERARMRAVFTRLTRLEEDDPQPGGERRDTRRRVTLDELVPAGSLPQETRSLLNHLGSARLVVTGTNPVSGQVEVEVAHEALIRHWPRLRAWLDEDRAALRLAEGVRDAALEWEQAGKDEALLVHHSGRLEDAFELLQAGRYTFNQHEVDYLTACLRLTEKQHRAAERRRRITIGASLGAALIMALLAIWGFQSAREADTQAMGAREQANRASRLLTTSEAQQAEIAMRSTAQAELLVEANRLGTQSADDARAAQEQAEINLGRQLALQAQDAIQINPATSILLGIEAAKRYPESTASQAIMAGLDVLPRKQYQYDAKYDSISYPAGPDLFQIYTDDWKFSFFDLRSGETIDPFQGENVEDIHSAVASPDGSRIAIINSEGVLFYQRDGGRIERSWPDEFTTALRSSQATQISADWSKILTVDDTSQASLWDMESGQPLGTFLISEASLILLNRDGTRAVAWPDLIDTISGEEIYTSEGGELPGSAFSADGKTWVTLSDTEAGRILTVVDASSGLEERLIRLPPAYMLTSSAAISMAVSPDGRFIATGGADQLVYLWDAVSGQPVWTVSNPAPMYQVKFSQDGQKLLTASSDGLILIRETGSGRIQSRILTSYMDLMAGFGRDGQQVYATDFQSLTTWELPERPAYRLLDINMNEKIGFTLDSSGIAGGAGVLDLFSLTKLVFSPEGNRLIFAAQSPFSEIRLGRINVQTGDFSVQLGRGGEPFALYPEPGLVSGWLQGDPVGVWAVGSYTKEERKLADPEQFIFNIRTSYDGRMAVSVLDDGRVWVWDTTTGKGAFSSPHGNGILPGTYDLAHISGDGTRVTTIGAGGITAWDSRTGEQLRVYENKSFDIIDGIFSPDLKVVVLRSLTANKQIVVNLVNGKEILAPSSDLDSPVYFQFSPDSTRLAVLETRAGMLKVWDITRAPAQQVEIFHNEVMGAAFSRDNRWLISYSDSDARIWDLENQREMARVSHSAGLTGAALSSDGRIAATASSDGNLRVWLWQPQDLLGLACPRLEFNLSKIEWNKYIGEDQRYRKTCPSLPTAFPSIILPD